MLYVNGILLKVDEANEGQVLSTIKLAVTTEVEKIDRNKSCRICLNTYEKTDLFCLFSTNSMFQSLSVSAAIQECFQVTLQDQENFPRYVCVQCASSTLQAYTFKKCLLRSEDTLNSRLINQLPVEDINEILLCESDVKLEDLDDESCKLSIISDHNYSKDVVSDMILSTPLAKEETDQQEIVEKNVDDKLENHEITKKPKKYSMKPLSSHLEKWWRKSNGPPYICQICSREYGTKYNAFYTHIRTHFISKPPCPYCGKRFPYDKLLIHIRSHTNEKPFSCTQCSAKFSLQGNLNRHLVCHTGESLTNVISVDDCYSPA
ncbi:hypothetical protein FQA39_LY18901 [Lamprigera yunnana]|nr:hypothetical protein FQA39_LY18901 [Lamprigera yunnana]